MRSSPPFIKSYLKKLPVGLLALLIFFTAALFFFAWIAHEVLAEKEEAADQFIFNYLAAHIINSGLTGFMKAVTYFASAAFLQIAYACLIVFYLIIKDSKRVVEILAIGLGGFLVNYYMKVFFHRVRPPHPLIAPLQNFSFPSGHATSGFIFYGLLAYLVWKNRLPKIYKAGIASLLILFALLIGFSRVYLRLHYPSDVAAGFCIGFAWLILSTYLLEKLKKKTSREKQAT